MSNDTMSERNFMWFKVLTPYGDETDLVVPKSEPVLESYPIPRMGTRKKKFLEFLGSLTILDQHPVSNEFKIRWEKNKELDHVMEEFEFYIADAYTAIEDTVDVMPGSREYGEVILMLDGARDLIKKAQKRLDELLSAKKINLKDFE